MNKAELKMMMSGVAGMAISQALKNLALDEECTDRVGRSIYEREAQDALTKPWASLNVDARRIWKERAQSAILGLLAFAQKK